MKEFLRIMMKDYREEDFTMKEFFIYGLGGTLGLLLVCGVAEWLNSL